MNRGVSVLLKAACDAAYKAGDKVTLRAARNKLKAGIKPAKSNHNIPWHMWQGIQTITDFWSNVNNATVTNASLLQADATPGTIQDQAVSLGSE